MLAELDFLPAVGRVRDCADPGPRGPLWAPPGDGERLMPQDLAHGIALGLEAGLARADLAAMLLLDEADLGEAALHAGRAGRRRAPWMGPAALPARPAVSRLGLAPSRPAPAVAADARPAPPDAEALAELADATGAETTYGRPAETALFAGAKGRAPAGLTAQDIAHGLLLGAALGWSDDLVARLTGVAPGWRAAMTDLAGSGRVKPLAAYAGIASEAPAGVRLARRARRLIPCMTCGQPIVSTGAGHRLCGGCAGTGRRRKPSLGKRRRREAAEAALR